MRVLLALQFAALLSFATDGMAAEVKYQHPELTIVAQQEPLDSVLKSLGREMRIFVTMPTGLNPMVSCNIQNQSIKQALKNLLGDVSYSLEWEDGGERLAGLTIFVGGGGSAVANASVRPTQSRSADQAALIPVEMGSGRGASPPVASDAVSPLDDDTTVAEREAQMEIERAEVEDRMAEEREAHEAEMELRRQEEEIAHEARMKEEIERHEAETKAYLESQGIQLPQ